MRYPGIQKKRQFSLFNLFLLIIGVNGMIFAVTFDFFNAGIPNFGINQLAGTIISAIIALMGLRKIGPLRSRIWDRLLLTIYLAGILFMGLRPVSPGFNGPRGMLQVHSIYFPDVVENILGFVPLGYLMMIYILSIDRLQKKHIAILNIIICIGISLLIELSQYYIPGRESSLSDIFFNGLGAFGATIFCLLEKKFSYNN
jgi:VanZ family protein